MLQSKYEIRRYSDGGLPCFCHFGYISAKDTPYLPNCHPDIEIILCTKGEGYAEYGESRIDFTVGDMIVVNSGVSHRFLTKTYVEYWFLIIEPKFHSECGYAQEDVTYVKKFSDTDLNEIYMKIVDITHSDDRFRMLKTRIECSKLLLGLFEKYADTVQKESEKPYIIHSKKAIEYIAYNYASQITIDSVAEYVGINRSRLTKEFRRYTGGTILEQVNMVRCDKARRLIEENEKIFSAMQRCGFDNRSYFTKIYRKYVGELPSETKNGAERAAAKKEANKTK